MTTAFSAAGHAMPFVLLVAMLAWAWRVWDLAHAVPSYEDTLEVLWLIRWYNGALQGLHPAGLYPLAFFPAGWQVATFAGGPAIFALLLPLSWLGGPAFASNVYTLLTFVLAFAGAYYLAKRLIGRSLAAIVALLFAFWGYRWYGVIGHHNVLLASALIPWLLLAVENALQPRRSQTLWLVVTGVVWALMSYSSLYFIWMGGLLLAGWLAGRYLGHQINARTALLGMSVPAGVALVLLSPWLLIFVRASAAANAPFYDLAEVSSWDASLNSFPVPSVFHPWLAPLARLIYQGPVNEPGLANFGLVASLLALASVYWAWRDRRWWPVLILGGTGLLLALGLTLKWNGDTVQWGLLRPLDSALWRIGHVLKPGLFDTLQPPPIFATAVPLPGLLLSMLVPFWERARVFTRYALLASTGVFLLAALTLTRLRVTWARVLLGVLLVFEVVPPPTANLPYPLQPHPAFAWLAQQTLPAGEAVIDLGSWQPDLVFTPIGGEILWETDFHHKPVLGGASSVWPAPVVSLNQWLAAHPHPFKNAEFVPLLRSHGARWILFHVSSGTARDMLEEARQNRDLEAPRCFDPQPGPSPWDYPLCLIQIRPGK